MSSFSVAPPLSGQVLGSVGDSFVIAEWRDGGGSFDPPRLIAPLHVHRRGEEMVEVRAGSGVLVTRGTPHTYWNPNPEPARYLLVMTTNIFQLIQGIHALTDRSPAAVRALFERHDSSLVEG